ncbi:1-phosphofructokinase family hexose kinase [Belliella marina]|uniref:1-phosphofructokinase family hexose kinase n=1 Tax=Belliella marina TaxID=1644146 RepID=A0ABW4VRM6_9BACT
MILTVCPNPAIDTFAYLPKIKLGKSNRIVRIQEFPGGKGIHVALAIKELEGEVELVGVWAGSAGEWIKSSCADFGLKVSGLDVKGNSRKCFTFITDEENSDHTEILEPGPKLAQDDFQSFKAHFKRSLAKANIVCISGSWPLGSPKDACQQLVRLANEQHVKVFLDCTGVQLENALKEKVFGLHLNESEYQETIKTLGAEALEDVVCLALTKGKEGLDLRYRQEFISAKLTLDDVISTVGSGDCLTAGLCYAIAKEMKIQDVAKFGVACGAANCLREDLGMLYKSDVGRLLEQVEFKN